MYNEIGDLGDLSVKKADTRHSYCETNEKMTFEPLRKIELDNKMPSLSKIEMEKIPVDECGEMMRSHLDMPLVTFPLIDKILNKWIQNVSDDQLLGLTRGDTAIDTLALVSDMSQALIEEIGIFLLEDFKIQISANPHEHVPSDNKNTSADTSKLMNTQTLTEGCSYCRVTQDDVQSSFGDLFDTCFGKFLETVQRRSHDSVRLSTLLSVEIAKNVNLALSHSTAETSVRRRRSTPESELKEIALHVINILHICMNTTCAPLCTQSIQSSDAESSGCSSLEEHIQPNPSEGCRVIRPLPRNKNPGSPNFEEVEDEDVQEGPCRKTLTPSPCVVRRDVGSNGKSPDFRITEAKNLEQHRVESFETTHSTKQSTESLSHSTECPHPQLPKCSIDEIFLRACLAKLIDHIAEKTHTSFANVDFHQIVTRVTERLVGEERYTTPQNVKNFHITIYKELCRKFRSKYVLQVLMETCDPAFVAALVVTLNGQLKKLMKKNKHF
ncbi:uncharacterized protein LOC115780081 [Archocentrus centrarchus]|uniref:uncharacterized protein LOC115780081 n=1 Tax=Archocentrus centrarchus TaxID=63155 RepID=UPI0011E9E125|nr:uncharacterized protein LOC115780081 [Archocentrus centrarchus]